MSGQVRYFQIEETEGSRALCLVCRKNLYQPEPLRYLLGLFREWVPKLYEPEIGIQSALH
ncbi:MAG: hypothetical protein LUG65_07390 [Clostridiales bacterium]|nr:hypothetical protein [Clostridiales bacterium]